MNLRDVLFLSNVLNLVCHTLARLVLSLQLDWKHLVLGSNKKLGCIFQAGNVRIVFFHEFHHSQTSCCLLKSMIILASLLLKNKSIQNQMVMMYMYGRVI